MLQLYKRLTKLIFYGFDEHDIDHATYLEINTMDQF